MKVLEDCTIYS